jgi:hypothetical protein
MPVLAAVGSRQVLAAAPAGAAAAAVAAGFKQ